MSVCVNGLGAPPSPLCGVSISYVRVNPGARLKMDSSEQLEWRQARQWLIVSGVIPPTHRVTKPDVDLVDFARSLRDGVFLCSLLLKLKADCIQDSDWNSKPLMQVC